MSFDIFKKNMLAYMGNQSAIESHLDFSKKLTMEYDICMRRGFQIGNSVSVAKANTEMMETQVGLAGTIALQKQKGLHHIINDIGKGVVGYWSGATLNLLPVPIIPAFGAYLNIATNQAMVSKPGDFPDMKNQSPVTNSGQFLDLLIVAMTIHLTTIEGFYFTTSLYPGFPTVPPAPGVVSWVGYNVPPAQPTVVEPITIDIVPQEPKSVKSAITLEPEQEVIADGATDLGHGLTLSTSAGLTRATVSAPTEEDKLEVYPISNDTDEPTEYIIMEDCNNIKIKTPPIDLIIAMRKWGIIQPLERAHFLAQCAHESGNFYYKREIWGPTRAQRGYDTHRYLGNEKPGDGYKYLGRGFIQLTGLANYRQFNKGVEDDVVAHPELVETKYRSDAACWFWATRKLNRYAIDDTMASITEITRRINGGRNGLTDRANKFCAYWREIENNPDLYS